VVASCCGIDETATTTMAITTRERTAVTLENSFDVFIARSLALSGPIIPFLGDTLLAQMLVEELGDLGKYLHCLRRPAMEVANTCLCNHGQADCDLATPRDGTQQEKICDIGARQQQERTSEGQ